MAKGTSLIEVLISLSLVSCVALSTSIAMIQGVKAYRSNNLAFQSLKDQAAIFDSHSLKHAPFYDNLNQSNI